MNKYVKEFHNIHHFVEISPKFILLIVLFIILIISLQCESSKSPVEENDQGIFTDNFDGDGLNSKWYWSNEPDSWDLGLTRSGWLTITGNFNSNLGCSDETSSLYQILESDTDFDVSTRLYCEWGNNSSDIAGMIVKFPSDTNWIIIKFWMHGDSTGRLEFQKKCTDIISPVPGSESLGRTRDIFLRMVKEGIDYTGYYKNNSGDDWIEIGTTEGFDSLPIHLGIFGGVDQGNGNLLIQYDFFNK
jgi:beta-xylosidase-like protein